MHFPVFVAFLVLAAISLQGCCSASAISLSGNGLFYDAFNGNLNKGRRQRLVADTQQKYGRRFNQRFVGDQGFGGGFEGGYFAACAEGEILNVDGECARPIVSRNVFVYDAPQIEVVQGPPPEIPQPKVDYNIVFVRTPKMPEDLEPIVIPPPLKKTLVYVLAKKQKIDQQVIEVPAGPNNGPQVFYVSYKEGDNPTLPGGVSLQEALASIPPQEAKVIGDFSGGETLKYGASTDTGFRTELKSGSKHDGAQAYAAPAPAPLLPPAKY